MRDITYARMREKGGGKEQPMLVREKTEKGSEREREREHMEK